MSKSAWTIQLPPTTVASGAEQAVYDGYWLSRQSDVVAKHCAVAALLSSSDPAAELLDLARDINEMVRDNYRQVRELDEAWGVLRERLGDDEAHTAAETAMAPVRACLADLDELLALAVRTQKEFFKMGWDFRDIPDLGVPPWPFEDEDVDSDEDEEAP